MRLITGCGPIDDLLGGGLESGIITLVYGEAGTGKTNLCLQSARNAARQGPGKVGYLDTEGVSMDRLQQISTSDHAKILKSILFFAPQTLAEQEKMVRSLTKLKEPPLVVVDSMNMHYRLSLGDEAKAAGRSITRQMGDLLGLARKADIPVLVTGQVYTDEESVSPFGGRIMEHIVKVMMRLERTGPGRRRAILRKHRSRPEDSACAFQITDVGLE